MSFRARSRRLVLAAAAVTVGIAASALTQVAVEPQGASAAGTNLVCDNNTIYAIVGAGSGGTTNGDLYQIDATTGAASRVTSMSPAANALGLTKNGTQAWAFQNGSNKVVEYDPTAGTPVSSTTVAASVNAIRGAVDPVNDIYYYASSGATSTIYAYDITSGTDIGEVGTFSAKGGNGDMAFGTDGTLYLVDTDQIFAIKGVPSTAGTAALSGTLIATLPSGTNSPGIAYSADGYLYLLAGSTSSTVYKIDPGVGASATPQQVTIAGGLTGFTDLASCNYANSLRSQADVRSRVSPTDQFTLTNTGFASGNTATTSGTATGVQAAIAGPSLAVGQASYTVTQSGSGSTDLSTYSVTWSCVNTTTSTTVASGSGNTASFTFPQATTADGSDVLCTFVDAVKPVATADSATTPADTLLTVAAPGVLSNDSGAGIQVVAGGTQTAPSHGSVVRNADGSYSYQPASGYSGPDSFPYQITDVNGATASSLVNITVTPTASPDSASTGAETPIDLSTLTANDQGTSLVVTSATQPAHGTTTVTNGVVTYTPAAGYVGPDSFDYTATDGSSLHQTVTSTVSITVSPGAADDTATTTAGTPVTTAVLTANDHGSLTAQSITQPSHGTAVLNPDGTATYTPDAGYSGPDSFTYTATDGGSTSSTANVNITVTPAIADADPTTTIDTPITVDAAHGLLSTAHGSGLTATKTTSPAHGSVVVNADGSYTYTPDPGFIGTDSFGFSVTDSSNQTVTGQASIDVVALTPALAHTGLDGSLVGTITGGGVGALLLGLGLLAFGLLSRSPRTRRHRAVR